MIFFKQWYRDAIRSKLEQVMPQIGKTEAFVNAIKTQLS
jgi:hypothetical protein